MINFLREDKRSIWLKFDQQGLGELIYAFETLSENNQVSVDAFVDSSIVTLKSSNMQEASITMSVGPESIISKLEKGLLWIFEPEDVPSAIEQFQNCRSYGQFAPPEFVESQVFKNKNLDHIFCELVG